MASRASRPLGALVSQAIVAGSSLVLQFIALRELGAAGLGSFSLLLGILITVNAIQSGWLGDSLTVLDRFEPGIRRALVHSQVAIVIIVGALTTALALPVGGVDGTTAVLFGLASVMWVIEETLRRILIARREFWKLVANDAAFAAGSFGLLGYVAVTGAAYTLQTLVLALLAGAVVAIGVGVVQLPRVELSRGIVAASRLGDVASFAIWRAAQVGLRPASQAIVRAAVATFVSLEALGQLEAARLLLAPVLTAVSGAGVYLLPTYAAQAKQGRRFHPRVEMAMLAVGGMATGYGLLAIALRTPLADLLTDGVTSVTAAALVAWTLFSIGFGIGVPPGNAMVARGRSRRAFVIRTVDAAVGVGGACLCAVLGWVDAVPAGLALGTFVGAALLVRAVRTLPAPDAALPPPSAGERVEGRPDPPGIFEFDLATAPVPTLQWEPIRTTQRDTAAIRRPRPTVVRGLPEAADRRRPRAAPGARVLWVLPLVLIVATEYKFRRRSIDDALAGSIDPMIALELGVYGLVAVWMVWRLAPAKPRLTPLMIVMWGYVLTTASSALYSAFPLLGLARAVQLVIIAGVVHVVAADGTLATIERLLHGWIVLITLSIGAGLVYVAPTTLAQIGRFTWLYVHSVSAGSMLAISVPVLFGLWLSAGRQRLAWPRSAYAVLFAVHFVALLATRTRGSIGGAAVAVALMAWLWSGQRMKPQLVLATLIAGAATVLAFGGPVLNFVTRGESADQIGTFNRRTEIWTLAWDSFLSHPLHGLGFTSAKGVFFDQTGLGGAHNALINVMIDAGLVGLCWWLLVLGMTVTAIRRLRPYDRRVDIAGATGTIRSDRLVLIGIVTASLFNSITTEGLGAGVNVSAIWWFLVMAWVVILDRAVRRTPPPVAGAPTAAGRGRAADDAAIDAVEQHTGPRA